MPRGRPPKNKGITIKSKETQIFIGFMLVGLGFGIVLTNVVNGIVPHTIYKMLGVNRYILGILLILAGLKLIGLKHHITSSKMSWGLGLLFIVSSIFLGFLWETLATLYYPGTIGLSMHEFLFEYLGPYIEIFTLVPILILSVSLIFDMDFTKLAELFKETVAFTIDSLIFSYNFILKVAKFIINATKSSFSFIFSKLKSIKKPKAQEQEIQNNLDINLNIPEINTNPDESSKQEQEISKIEENPDTLNSLSEQIKEPDTTQNLKVQEQEQDIQINFGKPLYQKSEPKVSDTKQANIKLPQEQEETIQISPVAKRFAEIYAKHTITITPPPLTIFDKPIQDKIDKQEILETSRKIEEALASFKIQARVTKYFVGPSVIQYALNLATGTKVAKVQSLAKDIALAIAAPSGSLRIQTISGTNLVGIEVPRVQKHLVKIAGILRTPEFTKSIKELPMAIGKNVQARPVVINLYDMPHLLVAGATGTGKSVALNTILASFLIRFSPKDLRVILVDPKMVEMELYNGIPHLLTPVITDMNQVVGALEWLLFEMQQRYLLFKEQGVRNLKEYNTKAKQQGLNTLPYIVLIIDEMADLILTKRNEVETKIVRLAQLARATGIHLILATQRPSVNVITGLIKANIPARIALTVTSGTDSRVIIDQTGAETLIGKGDMLIKLPNSVKLERVQGAFISTQEVQRLTNYLKNKAKEKTSDTTQMYMEELINYMQTGGKPKPNINAIKHGDLSQLASLDELLPQAVELVLKTKKPSASSLQRYLHIGFNRAARLIDHMEDLGIISAPIGNKREVLINSLEDLG